MRDKKDNATFDLPGFAPALEDDAGAAVSSLAIAGTAAAETRRAPRPRRSALKQEQLSLPELADTDATGLPVWKHDPDLDLTGLPIWKPAA